MTPARPAQSIGDRRTGTGRPPPVYRPLAYPGRPSRWDEASIVEALRSWVTVMGAPPRRDDWSGQRTSAPGAAQRKWMAEHPAWPSSSCVADHFGSWSAALDAAGLSARRLTFDSSVTERVQAARRLAHAGRSTSAIARELGVSRSGVHNYLRAMTCPECGGPVTNPSARRCSACAAHEPSVTRAWTYDTVRDAIRDWIAETGSPPTYRDWTPSRARPGRWEAESPRWPSAAVVCALYGDRENPWNSALADAGADIRFRRWTDASLRTALARFWIETGRQPHSSDLAAGVWDGPHPATLRRRYGSVHAAWRTLGPAPADG